MLVFVFGELNDKNCVFRGEADQHHETDLRINVAFDLDHVGRQNSLENHAAQPEDEECSEDCDWGAQQDAEGQRPAFVERGENQEHEQQGERKNSRRGHTLAGFLFEVGDAGVIESHLARHGLFENFFKSGCGLVGAVAGSGATVQLGGTKFIESQSEFWSEARLDGGKSGKRNAFFFIVEDVELSHVFCLGAVFGLGFDINLPLAAKAIEVVDEVSAHESLHGAVDVAQAYSLLENLVAVDVDELLRNAGQESGAEAGDLGPLASS